LVFANSPWHSPPMPAAEASRPPKREQLVPARIIKPIFSSL
jgi:hypothetical protein